MYELFGIIKGHFKTFYDYRSKEPENLLFRYSILLLLSALFAFIFPYFNKDFLSSVIGVFSILIGFTLNVLFYLISKPLFEKVEPSLDRTLKLKFNKMQTLQNEIISNVLYFNLVSLFVVSISVLFLTTSSVKFGYIEIIEWNIFEYFTKNYDNIIITGVKYFQLMAALFYYFLLSEVFMNLFRLVSRVSFLFREKTDYEKSRVIED